jgi:hypothetical protein
MFKFLFEYLAEKIVIFNRKVGVNSLFLIIGVVISVVSIILFNNKLSSIVLLPFFIKKISDGNK